jgi:hypothetical protein
MLHSILKGLCEQMLMPLRRFKSRPHLHASKLLQLPEAMLEGNDVQEAQGAILQACIVGSHDHLRLSASSSFMHCDSH